MISRLDAFALTSWLLMGAIIVENSHRIDHAAPRAEPIQAVAECEPHARIRDLPSAFLVSVALAGDGAAAYVHTIAGRCETAEQTARGDDGPALDR